MLFCRKVKIANLAVFVFVGDYCEIKKEAGDA